MSRNAPISMDVTILRPKHCGINMRTNRKTSMFVFISILQCFAVLYFYHLRKMLLDPRGFQKLSPCSSPQLQHHSCLGIQTIDDTKCSPNAAPQVRINCRIYSKLKIMITFTLNLGLFQTPLHSCAEPNW